MPWDRNAGGSRVQLEVGEELAKLGHQVEKFSYEDAFPRPLSRWESLTVDFAIEARKFIRQQAHRFDIIDAHQGNLPFSKADLGFQGLLVARTVGLYVFVDEFLKFERQKWPTRKWSPGSALIAWLQWKNSRHYYPSLRACDLLNLPNHDEQAYVSKVMGLGDKTAVFPFGLTAARLQAFGQTSQAPTTRLRNQQVVFIGGWQTRKGSKDWPEIIRRIRSQVPQARFLFLGTGVDREKLLPQLGLSHPEGIEVIPNYDSDDLPRLLSGGTVGAFPSYMEGFGFSVLEKLASGIPVIAYDVAGPREMLKHLDPSWMVAPGDLDAFCQRLVTILKMNEPAYLAWNDRCMQVAQSFCWADIARDTIEVYTQFWQRLTPVL